MASQGLTSFALLLEKHKVSGIETQYGGRLKGKDLIAVDEVYIRGLAADPQDSPFNIWH